MKQARQAKGLTQEQVAAAVSPPVRRETVNAWEHSTLPSRAYIRQLGPLYGVACTWLEGYRADPAPPVWLTPEQLEWVAIYDRMPPEQRQAAIEALLESEKLFERLT